MIQLMPTHSLGKRKYVINGDDSLHCGIVPGSSKIPSNTTANWESSCIFKF